MARGSIAEADLIQNKAGPHPPNIKTKGDKGVAAKKLKPKRSRKLKHFGLILLLLLCVLVLLPFLIVRQITATEQSKIYTSVNTIPSRPVAMVLGAGVTKDSTPGWMLSDRLDAGIKLYQTGKVQTLLMSGGDVEVTIMRRYAEAKGVPAGSIRVDAAGLRTYDSCYRASHDLNIDSLIVVTQDYHLPRSLYLCNSLGVNAVGLKAGGDSYAGEGWSRFREFFAQVEAWTDVNVSKPKPQADS